MKKVTYESPAVEMLEIQQEQVCCIVSFESYSQNGDELDTDTDYDW